MGCLLTVLATVPLEVWARAGGGGGSRGGGLLTVILLPLLLIYSAIITWQMRRKHSEAQRLLLEIRKQDRSWDPQLIRSRVEMAYFKVQEAWMERNQELAREYVSDRLYEKHKAQTDLMLRQHRQNRLENIQLESVKIVQVADYTDDSQDSLWVCIEGAMIDYIVDDRDQRVLSGDANQSTRFKELWKFVRGPREWVLDEIDPSVSLSDLAGLHSFSEAPPIGRRFVADRL